MSTLDDRSRAGKRARRRGANGELEVRDLLREHGWTDSHRQWLSGGQGGGDLADAIPDVHLEVKFVQTLQLGSTVRQARAAARPTDTVVIAHRSSFSPWLATLRLTDFIDLAPSGFEAQAVGKGSVPSLFLALLKREPRPLLVHPLLGEALCTVLLTDLLVLLARAEADEAVSRR